ncbi:MAG: hypothetical protein U1C46_10225 [Bacteroidales bacterium]|nr:hypothetical protein [Bacteroidales bacterium]MDZ4205179.1 hypothetical protein [Bacteroidales bacterium]
MKKIIVFLFVSFLAVVLFYACQKDESQNFSNSMLESVSEDQSTRILAFKGKMAYYRNNPELKSEADCYYSSEAVLALEALVNFNFCHTGIECNRSVFLVSQVVMPLDEMSKINDPKLAQLYFAVIIDSIKAQINRVNYVNMKLLLVDLEHTGYDINGNAIISVGSLIGNEQATMLPDENWWYGENLGMCNGNYYAPEDAASKLAARITSAMIPSPGNNCRWYYTQIENKYIFPQQDTLNNPPVNYLDYKIFYATTAGGLIIDDEVKCLSALEMNFYKGHYNDYAIAFQLATNKKFSNCTVLGGPVYELFSYSIQHRYTIYVGKRWLECTMPLENILTY